MSANTKYHNTAGGVVLNAHGLALVLERDVMRDGRLVHEVRLPKGHIDPGESPQDAAKREVAEESGYGHTEILADLGRHRSEFTRANTHNVRDEHYFLMRLTSDERGDPEPMHEEEALFRPRWLPLMEAELALTYPSEQEFARRARAAIHTLQA